MALLWRILSCPLHVMSSCGQVVKSEEDSINLNLRKYFILVKLAIMLMSTYLLLTFKEPVIGSSGNLIPKHFDTD